MSTTTKTREYSIPASQVDLFDVDDINTDVRYHDKDYSDVKVYDDGMGQWYLFGHEFGPTMLIRAQSFQDAWEIAIDESPTIDESDVHEAYDMTEEEFHAKTHADRNESGEWPDLVEGYEYQSNATGTGIVDVGHYAWLNEIDAGDIVLHIVASGIHESIAGEYDAVSCLLDGNRGIYLPQSFVESFELSKWGIDAMSKHAEDIVSLQIGPDHEFYWESWDSILNDAKHIDDNGDEWHLSQDGDLFAIRDDVYFD